MGGVTLRHVITDEAIDDPARYRGTREDETRLLYVAATRAQKYLRASSSRSECRTPGYERFGAHRSRIQGPKMGLRDRKDSNPLPIDANEPTSN
jgi:superfamily I DNA/RNA helicase